MTDADRTASAHRSRGRDAPAHIHVLRRRRLHRALGPPRAGDLSRADAGLSRRVPRRHRSRASRATSSTARATARLSTFGFPVAHENDAERAVRAGLALVRAVARALDATAATGESLDLRVGIHHGPVYLDFDEDDIYGLAAERRRAAPGARRSRHGRRLGRGPAAGRGPFRDRGRRARSSSRASPSRCSRSASSASVARPGRALWSTPLVEREDELARLRAPGRGRRRRRARDRVLVRGDAGVGKSRLVCRAHRRVRHAGAVVQLHGSPFHVDAGFHPVRGPDRRPLRHRRRRRRGASASRPRRAR